MIAESPTPNLPRGAGGPLRRAAGRVSGRRDGAPASAARDGGRESASASPPVAVILEQDPLARLLVVPAVAALGLRVLEAPAPGERRLAPPPDERRQASGSGDGHEAPAVVFVPLDGELDCRRVCAAARAAGGSVAPPLVAGYGAGPPGLLAAHRAHRCADLVLRLTASAGGARFAHLPVAEAVVSAGLTEREADVLVLLLHACTTPAVAARLCISPNTARSHCRAVLRKLGAGDRRALRSHLLAASCAAPLQPLAAPHVEVCPAGAANFAETWPVAPRRRAAHT